MRRLGQEKVFGISEKFLADTNIFIVKKPLQFHCLQFQNDSVQSCQYIIVLYFYDGVFWF